MEAGDVAVDTLRVQKRAISQLICEPFLTRIFISSGTKPAAFHLSIMTLTFAPLLPSVSRRPRIMPTCTLSTSKSGTATFSAWAERNKIDLSRLTLATFGKLRGMKAETGIKKSEPLITVPASATIQTTSLSKRHPASVSTKTWRAMPWYARLALMMLDAEERGEFSEWLGELPRKFETPFYWGDEQLKELQNGRMEEGIREQRRLYRELYEVLNGDGGSALARKVGFERFVWAVECVRSRAFAGEAEVAPFKERVRLFLFVIVNVGLWPGLGVLRWEQAVNGGLTALFAIACYDVVMPRILRVVQGVQLRRFAMTPGIDFLNHCSRTRAEVAYEYFRDRFVVNAGEDYECGEQVFISYGRQGNDSLLQYYGFVEDDNPADEVVFADEVARLMGVDKLVLGRGGWDEGVVEKVGKGLGGVDKARVALRELCQVELGGMRTSVEEDREILKGAKGWLELAVRYRLGKKEILMGGMQ